MDLPERLDRYEGSYGEKMGLLRSIKLTWIICIFIGTGFITGIASADLFLYGTTSDGDAVGSTSTLVQIDHQDGDLLDTIGTGVGYLVNGMAWDRRSQRLYASTSTNDPAFTGLIVIDRASGVGTAVGTPDWGQGSGFSVSNITIDSNGNMVGWADNANQLVEIDKETGEITTFINIDNVTAINFGLSFDNINLLYLVNGMAWDHVTQQLYASTSTNDSAFTGLIVIDRGTGEGAAVGTPDWGQGSGFSVSNITIDSSGNMVGWADGTNQLVEIDKETGEITTFININNVTAVNFGLSFDNINLLYLVNGDASGDSSDLWVFVDNTQDFTDGPSVEHESRQGDFYPSSNLYYGIDHTGADTRSLVSIYVAKEEDNLNDRVETVDQLHTLAFVVTSSSDNGGSSTCFIRSLTNTD
jgi:hypothetical protein